MGKLFLAIVAFTILLSAANIVHAQTACTNEVASSYGNRVCRSDVDIAACNWPDRTENVTSSEVSSGIWEVNFISSSAVDVNIFAVYGRIIAIVQNQWQPYAGYIKPEVCIADSDENTCNPLLLGTHSYCSFRSAATPLMLSLPNPSVITPSNPARGFWPLPLSPTTHSATIYVNATDEARRRNISSILYYQFNKNLTGSSFSSWCVPGSACGTGECGIYTGCFENSNIANIVLCVKTQSSSTPVVMAACGHTPWESQLWDRISLNVTSAATANNTANVTNVSSPVTCSACDLGSRCSCTMTGCDSGMWIVRNTTYPPAMQTRTFNLPPSSIDLVPTASGSLEVAVVCENPLQKISKASVDVRGSMISCPAVCYVGRECQCQVAGCSNGTFAVVQNSVNIKTITFPPVVPNITFIPNSTDNVTITSTCFNPARGPAVLNFYPTPSTSTSTTSSSSTTTSILEDCPYDCCIGEHQYADKTCDEGWECVQNKCEGGTDYTSIIMIILILLLLIGLPFLLYVYFIRKKSKEKFDELYRRWSPRRRY